MWARMMRWFREVYPLLDNEGGFLQWLIPLLLTAFQYVRQEGAKREIEAAEAEKIPGQTAEVQEELLQRGMGGSSFFGPAVAEPARQYAISKRVRSARELLGTQTADPLAYGLEAIMQGISRKQGGGGWDELEGRTQYGTRVPRWWQNYGPG